MENQTTICVTFGSKNPCTEQPPAEAITKAQLLQVGNQFAVWVPNYCQKIYKTKSDARAAFDKIVSNAIAKNGQQIKTSIKIPK